MLSFILRRISAEEGYGNLSSNAQQRQRLVDYVNRAAQYLWDSLEMQNTDMELSTYVNMGAELITPAYVNRLIAVKLSYNQAPWDITDLRPRYSNTPWAEKWNHFREKKPTTLAVRLAAPTTLTFEGAADNTVITVTGPTLLANQVNESITMNQTSKTTSTVFSANPYTISKPNKSTQNIIVKDSLGQELGIIYNNLPRAFYRVFDVSVYPNVTWGTFQYPVQILYQEALPRIEDDEDEFPIAGWDEFLIAKTKQLLLSEKDFDAGQKRELDLVAQIEAWKSKQNEGKKRVIQVKENPLLFQDKYFNYPFSDKRTGTFYTQYGYYP
jgi:hypothetical protein